MVVSRYTAGAINVDELPSCDTVIRINLADVEESPTRYIDGQWSDGGQGCPCVQPTDQALVQNKFIYD